MTQIFLYNHGGSENHGCEALIRTVSRVMKFDSEITVYSENPQQDIHYDLQKEVKIESAVHASSRLSLDFLKAYIHLKLTDDYFNMDILPYLQTIRQMKKNDIEISVGGDIYCYKDYPKFIKLHQLIVKRDCKSVLLGCSLNEELFEDSSFVEDMRAYDFILARESLTYSLLKKAGLENIDLIPDTAFSLPIEKLPLPEGFIEGNTIGINLSPLAVEKEEKPGIVLENYKCLIRWILENSDSAIALIPHVVWKENDDRTVLGELYKIFKETKRVVMIQDCNCMQLKGYISRCRFFIGARTHATIAAYSTGVPTLVVGYSIKSRGIATDLFGTDQGYVVSVQSMKKENDLLGAFVKLYGKEREITSILKTIMPEYIGKIRKIMPQIESVLRRTK